MLQAEKPNGVVEWRKGLLVLHSTNMFAKQILPKYFNTRNFKTFRRQLNYYGFVHVRSFSTTGSCTTALWVNQYLAEVGSSDIGSVLLLKRVEPCESAKTAEGRRVRKELALHTVEEDLGVSTKTLQMDHIRALAFKGCDTWVPSEIAVRPEERSTSMSSMESSHSEAEQTSMYAESRKPGSDDLLLLLSKAASLLQKD
jgi:HSF-type DNA-binding